MDTEEWKINELNKRVTELEKSHTEQRKKSNEVKRTAWEALNIAIGNKDKVKLNSNRITDTNNKLDHIEENVKWITRSIMGVVITLVFTSILNSIWNVF